VKRGDRVKGKGKELNKEVRMEEMRKKAKQ